MERTRHFVKEHIFPVLVLMLFTFVLPAMVSANNCLQCHQVEQVTVEKLAQADHHSADAKVFGRINITAPYIIVGSTVAADHKEHISLIGPITIQPDVTIMPNLASYAPEESKWAQASSLIIECPYIAAMASLADITHRWAQAVSNTDQPYVTNLADRRVLVREATRWAINRTPDLSTYLADITMANDRSYPMVIAGIWTENKAPDMRMKVQSIKTAAAQGAAYALKLPTYVAMSTIGVPIGGISPSSTA